MLEALATPGCYGASFIEKLRLAKVFVENTDVHDGRLKPVKGKAKATVIVDVDIDQTHCHLANAVHGGCTAFLFDT